METLQILDRGLWHCLNACGCHTSAETWNKLLMLHTRAEIWKRKKAKVVFHTELSRKLQYNFFFCFLGGFCWVFLRSAQICCSGALHLRAGWAPGSSLTYLDSIKEWEEGKNQQQVWESRGFSQVVVTDQSTLQPQDSSNLANGLIQAWTLKVLVWIRAILYYIPQNWINLLLLLGPVSLV